MTSLATAMFLLPLLQLAQVCVEAVEALVPEDPVALHPFRGLAQPVGLQPGRTPLRVAAAGDETGLLEDLEMLRDGRQRHVEWLCELCHGRLPGRQPGEGRPPGR